MDENRSTVVERIRHIISNTIKISMEHIDANFSPGTTKNWDSSRHLDLVFALEEEFSIQFTDTEMVELVSVEIMAEIVQRALAR